MICDICKKNEATVHITKIINGNMCELNICETCAREAEGFNMAGGMGLVSPFSFQNILSGIVDYINQGTNATKAPELTCKNCGMTYSQFKEKGFFGCSECYDNFSSTVTPIISRVQGNAEHVGKIPKRSGKVIAGKKRILKLKEELQKAIAQEEYEKAAEIRDKIRELQNGE
ncbi:MAG: UvrB/UvrC motif-containing protein [Bacillota bacterium]|nr:UvrB/UvrC motif-containing protein [Bacillota bacterium]